MTELVKSVRASSDGNSDVLSTNLSIVEESIFNVNMMEKIHPVVVIILDFRLHWTFATVRPT